MKQQPIKTPTYVNAPGIVRTDFWSPDFDALVDNKGYDVIWEKAVQCPCGHRQNTAQTICDNCQGTGWVFINPMQIKAVASSLNKDTKYKQWSQEMIGTASFTVRSEYHLAFMDRLTILNAVSIDSENRIVFQMGRKGLAIRTTYPIGIVRDIFKFEGGHNPLRLLKESEYEISDSFIIFKGANIKAGDSVTITYEHRVQYYILDINHDIRNTIVLDSESREKELRLPVAGVGRRAQYVLDASNFTGDNVINNSYQ